MSPCRWCGTSRRCRAATGHTAPWRPRSATRRRRARAATTRPASQPGARPPAGGAMALVSMSVRVSSQAASEFEFHISPVDCSSRPQVRVGKAGTSSRSRLAAPAPSRSSWSPRRGGPRGPSGTGRSEVGAAPRQPRSRRGGRSTGPVRRLRQRRAGSSTGRSRRSRPAPVGGLSHGIEGRDSRGDGGRPLPAGVASNSCTAMPIRWSRMASPAPLRTQGTRHEPHPPDQAVHHRCS